MTSEKKVTRSFISTVHCLFESPEEEISILPRTFTFHLDTPIYKIIMFLFAKMKQSDQKHYDIKKCCLEYNNEILKLKLTLRDIDISSGSIKLKVHFYSKDHTFGLFDNWKSNIRKDLDMIVINCEHNVLIGGRDSKFSPIHPYCVKTYNPLLTIRDLLDDMGDDSEAYMTGEEFPLCSLRYKHQISDCLAMVLRDDNDGTLSRITYLKDKDGNINESTYSQMMMDYLGVDYLPRDNVKFTFLFYVHHELERAKIPNLWKNDDSVSPVSDTVDPDVDIKSIHFISDLPLLYQDFFIWEGVTIQQLKDFIITSCLIHPDFTIDKNDVVLLYKGQRIPHSIEENDESGIWDYFISDKTPSIHIQIIHSKVEEIMKTKESFWLQDFTNIEFVEEDLVHQDDHSDDDDDGEYLPNVGLGDGSDVSSIESGDVIQKFDKDFQEEFPKPNSDVKYVTDLGRSVQVLDGFYRKCIIDNKEEAFIEASCLEDQHVSLRLRDRDGDNDDDERIIPYNFIPISSSVQYQIKSDHIELEENVIKQLEKQLKMDIVPEEIKDIPTINYTIHVDDNTNANTNDNANFNPGRIRLIYNKSKRYILTSLRFGLLILQTFYYVVAGNFFFLIVTSELAFFLPLYVTFTVLGLIALRTITTESVIKNLWIEFFQLNRINETTFAKINKFIRDGGLKDEFYIKLLNDDKDKVLDPFINDLDTLDKDLLVKFKNREVRTQGFVNQIMILCLDKYINYKEEGAREGEGEGEGTDLLNDVGKKYIKDMDLFLIKVRDEMNEIDDSNLSIWGKIVRKFWSIQERISQFIIIRRIVEKIVPNPITDNWIVGIIKNIVLYFILLIPLANIEVDEVLEERKRELEARQRELEARQRELESHESEGEECHESEGEESHESEGEESHSLEQTGMPESNSLPEPLPETLNDDDVITSGVQLNASDNE